MGVVSAVVITLLAQQQTWDIPSIYSRALQVSPSAGSALQKLAETQAHVGEITAQRRLQLTLNGTLSTSHGHVDNPPSSESFRTVQGTLSLPIPNSGRIGALLAQAESQMRAARAGVHRSRLDVAFRSNDAYFGVLRARGAEQVAQQNYDQTQRQVADAQKRLASGDLAQADVIKSQVPAAQAASALSRAKSNRQIAEYTLNSLIQHDLAAPVPLADAPAEKPLDGILQQALAEAQANSPDVQEARAIVEAAEANLRVVTHGRDVDFTLQATQANTSDPTTYSRLTTFGLTFNLPLSDGGIFRQQVRQARFQLDQAKSALALATQQTTLSVQQAYLDVQADTAAVVSTRETLRIALDSYNKAQQAYAAGLTTTRDVLDAGIALAQARIDANNAVYDLAVARAKLEQLMGREPK